MITPDIYFANVCPTLDMNIRSELYSVNEFTFAVAVILSAQATDKKVNEVTPELFRVAPTPAKMLALGLDGLKSHIRVISFFNNKATNIIKLAEKLADGQGDDWRFPEKYHNRDELIKLPGIGQKTANVITNVLWGASNIGVDTHVFRLSHRFGWCDENDNTPEKVEAKLFQKNIMILSIMLWFCMGDIHVGRYVQSANYAPLQNGATQISRFQSSNDE